jgi:hypothetical protein
MTSETIMTKMQNPMFWSLNIEIWDLLLAAQILGLFIITNNH